MYLVVVVYLHKLAKPTAVIVPHRLCITKRLQQGIGLHNTVLYHPRTGSIWHSQISAQCCSVISLCLHWSQVDWVYICSVHTYACTCMYIYVIQCMCTVYVCTHSTLIYTLLIQFCQHRSLLQSDKCVIHIEWLFY